MRRWLAICFPLLVLVAAVYLRLENPRTLQELRLKVFDSYQAIKPREFLPDQTPARIVDIDEESLKRYGQWPWPRPLLATLVERLTQAGAAIIVFDVVFAEPDRTSPSRLLQEWQTLGDAQSFAQLRVAGANLPDHDRLFAEAIGRSAVILGFVLLDQPNDVKPGGSFGLAQLGDDPRAFVPTFRGATSNLELLGQAALGQASFNSLPDSDNIVRNNTIISNKSGGVYWRNESKAMAAHRITFENNTIQDNVEWGIFVDGETGGTILRNNTIEDSGKNIQKTGIRIGAKAGSVTIGGNRITAETDIQDLRPSSVQ